MIAETLLRPRKRGTVGKGLISAVTGRWHYILNRDGTEELYDVPRDRAETDNLAAEAELRPLLQRFRGDLPTTPRIRDALEENARRRQRAAASTGPAVEGAAETDALIEKDAATDSGVVPRHAENHGS